MKDRKKKEPKKYYPFLISIGNTRKDKGLPVLQG